MKSVIETVWEAIAKRNLGARFTSREIADQTGITINRVSASISRLLKTENVEAVGKITTHKTGGVEHIYQLVDLDAPSFTASRGLGGSKIREGGASARKRSLPLLDHGCGETATIEAVPQISLDLSALFMPDPEPEAPKKSLSERLLELAVEVEALERKVANYEAR